MSTLLHLGVDLKLIAEINGNDVRAMLIVVRPRDESCKNGCYQSINISASPS